MTSNTTFDGQIADGVGATAITKTGSGTLTLTGTNGFSGGLKVNAGVLLINGIQSMLGNTTLSVASGAILGGSGTILGTVTNSGGDHFTRER